MENPPYCQQQEESCRKYNDIDFIQRDQNYSQDSTQCSTEEEEEVETSKETALENQCELTIFEKVLKTEKNEKYISDAAQRARILENFETISSIHPTIKARHFDKHVQDLFDEIYEMYQHFHGRSRWALLTRLDGALERLILKLREIFYAEVLREKDLEGNDIKCCTCSDMIKHSGLKLAPCSHKFHPRCLKPADKYGRICPICVLECPLCTEEFALTDDPDSITTLFCGHIYHRTCWKDFIELQYFSNDDEDSQNITCPYCRKSLFEELSK